MAKFSTFFTIALILSFAFSHAARSDPSFTIKAQKENVEAEKAVKEESCQGLNRDDCLMRRTLVAHLDYIYTQETKP